MTRLFIAAGALLLGTSTIAIAADVDLSGKSPVDKGAIAISPSLDAKSGMASDKGLPTTTEAKLAAAPEDAKLALASSADWSDKPSFGDASQPKLQTAALDTWSDDPKAELKTASAETWSDSPADPAVQTGVGGPVDDGAVTTAALTPRPAAGNYPPCEPGPGDDNCIQLYEPGVRAELASWNAPTGGLADGSSTTAMGGPYEPVAEETALAPSPAPADDYAMNGDGTVDSALGETSDGELATAEVTDHSAYQGVGGPVEAQSGYPPCEPGPGDDRCIQLYERGVTGAGN